MKKVILIFLITTASVSMAQDLRIQGNVKFLALGDSYTIGESVLQTERWPVQLIHALRAQNVECFDPKLIATTGWRTDQLKSAIKAANLTSDYTLVSLLIGVNNQYQGKSAESYTPEFEELLKMAIALAGNDKSRVFVVSIPDYGYTPFGKSNQPAISKEIDAFNEVNRSISNGYGIQYFNITGISRKGLEDPDLVASDGLHPSGKMYSQWVDLIMKNVTIVKDDTEGNGGGGTVTGIRDERFGINLYPNPFGSQLTIENLLYLDQPVTFRLIDMKGALAYNHESVLSDRVALDTTLLPPGLYQYQLQDAAGQVISGKLVKE